MLYTQNFGLKSRGRDWWLSRVTTQVARRVPNAPVAQDDYIPIILNQQTLFTNNDIKLT